MLVTTGSRLERLDMKLKATDAFQLCITAPPAFAHNIRALQPYDHIDIHDMGLILPHLPNLIRLEIGLQTQRPIESMSELVRALQIAEAAQLLMPLNTSLKLLRVWPSRFSMSKSHSFPRSSPSYSPVFFYCNMSVDLVCRLPALEIMRVNISPMDLLHHIVKALVLSGITSENVGHLQRLQLRPAAE